MIEEKNKLLHLHSIVLVTIYNFLYEKGEVFFPVQNIQILNIDSTVKTGNADYYGKARFPHSEDKASAYFCYLIKDHPVIDGNKRLALLWLEVYCHINNLKINPAIHLDELAILVEAAKMDLCNLSVKVRQNLFK